MPEDLISKCEECGLVYNKITYPECPRCRHLRRKKAQKPEPSPAPAPGAPTPPIGLSAPRPASATRSASVKDTGAAPPMSGWRIPLWLVAAFFAGAVAYLAGINLVLNQVTGSKTSLLRSPPVVDVPRYLEKVKVIRREELTEGPASIGGFDAGRVSGTDVIQIGRWSKSVNVSTNKVQIRGVVENVSDSTVTEVMLSAHALDVRSSEIASDKTLANPSDISPGEEAAFQLELPNDPRATTLVFSGAWSQKIQADLQRIPLK